jgi:hypothetical protein
MSSESPLKKEPTAAEAMFFYAIVKHMKNKADIDWHAVAEEQGFKNAEVAKVRMTNNPHQHSKQHSLVPDVLITDTHKLSTGPLRPGQAQAWHHCRWLQPSFHQEHSQEERCHAQDHPQ